MATRKKLDTRSNTQSKVIDDEVDTLLPMWDERDLEMERWSSADAAQNKSTKDKSGGKWPFEDPTGPVILPPSLQHLVKSYKRIHEVISPLECHVVSPDRMIKRIEGQFVTQEENLYARLKNLSLPESLVENEVSLVTPNVHIFQSELMRWLITHLTFLQREPTAHDAHTSRPWDLIYPQREGRPVYNPGGKYAVRVFWLGCWRRITVDDSVPLDAQGRVLLPRTSIANEAWSLIIAKVACRIASLTYEQAIGKGDFGDANVLQMFTGWIRVPYSLSSDRPQLLELLSKRCTFPPAIAQFEADGDDKSHDEPSPLMKELSPIPEDSPISAASPTVRTAPKSASATAMQAAKVVPSARKPPGKESARLFVDSASRLKSGQPGEDPVTGGPINKIPMVYAIYGADSPVSHTDVGLPGRLSHPVRILSCHYIGHMQGAAPEDYYKEEHWIVELESPLVLFSGKGGFNNILPNYKVIQTALNASFEREYALQLRSLQLRGKGIPFAPFRFRMIFKDFCTLFKTVVCLQKDADFRFRTTIIGSKDMSPTLIGESALQNNNDKDKDKDDPAAIDLSLGRPWLLFVHSESHLDLIVSFSISQPKAPRESICFPSSVALDGAPLANMIRQPEVGTLELEVFTWQIPSSGKISLRLSTTGTTSTILRLPPGRNVYRVVSHVPAYYTLTVMADKEFLIASELSALRQMGSCSTKFMHHAFGVIKAIKYLVSLKKDDANEFFRKLSMVHVTTYGIPEEAMFVFWRAFVASLEIALQEQWYLPLSADLPISVGEAWTMLCGDLHKEIIAAFATFKKKEARKTKSKEEQSAQQSRKKKMPRLKAAMTIQRFFRGWQGRQLARVKRQERIQRLRSAALSTWENVTNNMTDFSMMLFRRMYDINPAAINLFPFAKDESLRCVVKDYTAKSEERVNEEWFIMSQDVVKVTENTTVNARLHVPTISENSSFLLHIIDNDNGTETPTTFGQPQPTTLKANKRGYTIMTTGRSTISLPSFAWGIRILSNPDFPTDPLRGGMASLTTTVPIREVTGACKPRRETLFRYHLSTLHPEQVVSFQLSVSKEEAPNAVITLQFYRDDEVLLEHSGVCSALIPFAILGQPCRRESSLFRRESTLHGRHDSAYSLMQSGAGSEPIVEYFIVGKLQGEIEPEEHHRMLLDVSQDMRKKGKGGGGNGGGGGGGGGSGRKKLASSSLGPNQYPQWTLKIHSKDAVVMSADMQREEEIKSIKAAWEAVDPGRRDRGDQMRLKFLQKSGVENNNNNDDSAFDPFEPAPAPAHPSTHTLAHHASAPIIHPHTPMPPAPKPRAPVSAPLPAPPPPPLAVVVEPIVQINTMLSQPPSSPAHSQSSAHRFSLMPPNMTRSMSDITLSVPTHHRVGVTPRSLREKALDAEYAEYKLHRQQVEASRQHERQAIVQVKAMQANVFAHMHTTRESILADVFARRSECRKRMIAALEPAIQIPIASPPNAIARSTTPTTTTRQQNHQQQQPNPPRAKTPAHHPNSVAVK